MRPLLIIAIFLLVVTTSYAQNSKLDVIEVDTLSKIPVSKLPFDQSFILKYQFPKDMDITGFEIWPLNRRQQKRFLTRAEYRRLLDQTFHFQQEARNWRIARARRAYTAATPAFKDDIIKGFKNPATQQSLTDFRTSLELGVPRLNTIPPESPAVLHAREELFRLTFPRKLYYAALKDKNFVIETTPKKSFMYLFIPPLNPNGLYRIRFSARTSDINDLILTMIQTVSAGNQAAFRTMVRTRSKLRFFQNNTELPATSDAEIDAIFAIINGTIGSRYTTITTSVATFRTGVAGALTLNASILNTGDALLQNVFFHDAAQKLVTDRFKDHIALCALLQTLTTDNASYRSILMGEKSFNLDLYTQKPKDLILGYEANYKKSLENLDKVIELISFLEINDYRGPGSLSTLKTEVQGFKTAIQANKTTLDGIASSQSTLIGSVKSVVVIEDDRSGTLAGTTFDFNFKARNGYRFIPDFGLIGVFSNSKDIQDNTQIVPYLGFQVNFRPINKDIPFRLVRYKTIWHRLSLSSGLTLSSIVKASKGEDLFGKKSLILGGGFRITNELRITTGGVLFMKKHLDPKNTSKYLSAYPFLGLSLDLDLKSLTNGISSLFNL